MTTKLQNTFKYSYAPFQNVRGEVYDVNDTVLQKLDRLECHPTIYEREKVPISLQQQVEGDQITECWCYFLTDFHPNMLTLPFLETYDAFGAQRWKQDRPDYAELDEFWRDIKAQTKVSK